MEPQPFWVEVNGESVPLVRGECAVTMFREENKQHIDYLTIKKIGEAVLHCFGDVDTFHWMAGYAIVKDEKGDLARPTMLFVPEDGEGNQIDEGYTFRSEYGWNPMVWEKDTPTQKEEDMYANEMARRLDDEWRSYEHGD